MAPSKKTMERLERAAAALNEATDGFTDTIEKLETRLAKAKVGITTWLDEELDEVPLWKKEVEVEGDFEIQTGWTLGYARIDEAWHFAIREIEVRWNTITEEIEAVPKGDVKLLLKATRSARVWASEHLERLMSLLADKAEKFAGHIEDAKKLVEEG